MTSTYRVPLAFNAFGDEERHAVEEILASGHLTMGKNCAAFEEEFAERLGVRHAIFVNSGSSANLISIFAIANPRVPLSENRKQLRPGDEVIVPALTWSTTIWPVVQAGGCPVLVDCDPNTLQMDINAVRMAISAKTVAILPTHIMGNSVDMDAILDIAEEHNLWVIEDCCEALGTQYDNRNVGTFGAYGTFSFYFSHHMTTIEGGMVVTNDDHLADLARCLRAHGWVRDMNNTEEFVTDGKQIDTKYLFVNTGFNLRPTEFNGAIGRAQIRKLDNYNRRRMEIASIWNQTLEPLAQQGKLYPMRTSPQSLPVPFAYPVHTQNSETKIELQQWMENAGIETRPIVCGNMARHPAFEIIEHRIIASLDGADKLMDCGFYWGIDPEMDNANVKFVADTVRKFFEQ